MIAYILLGILYVLTICGFVHLRKRDSRLIEALKKTNTALNETREEVAKHKKQLKNL